MTGPGRDGSRLIVFRYESCGDTFPVEPDDEGPPVRCPTCGSTDVHHASEPLL